MDTAWLKRLRIRQEMEIKRYKSLNWMGLELLMTCTDNEKTDIGLNCCKTAISAAVKSKFFINNVLAFFMEKKTEKIFYFYV